MAVLQEGRPLNVALRKAQIPMHETTTFTAFLNAQIQSQAAQRALAPKNKITLYTLIYLTQ